MNWRKIIQWVVVIFALYTIFHAPDKAADLVRSAFDGMATGGNSVKKFFDALVK